MAATRLQELRFILRNRVIRHFGLVKATDSKHCLFRIDHLATGDAHQIGQIRFATTARAKAYSGQGEKLGLSSLILLLPPAITLFLGSWQVQRRQWKMDLLELRKQRLNEDAVPLSVAIQKLQDESATSTSSATPGVEENWVEAPMEYRRVFCEGGYDESRTLYVGPRVKSVYGVGEKGYYVITTFIPDNSENLPPVLVNRGWVPSAWREARQGSEPLDAHIWTADAESASVAGESKARDAEGNGPERRSQQTSWWWSWSRSHKGTDNESRAEEAVEPGRPPLKLSGVVRGSETPSSFVPPNSPETGQWFYVDVPQMATYCGLPGGAILLDLVQESGGSSGEQEGSRGRSEAGGEGAFPVPKDVSELVQQKVMPQDHLTYAATWYTLSAATTFLAYKRLRGRPVRRPRGGQ